MDISETTSLDSTAALSIDTNEACTQEQSVLGDSSPRTNQNHYSFKHTHTLSDETTLMNDNDDYHDIQTNNLNNIIFKISQNFNLLTDPLTVQKSSTPRTLTHSHPLMLSPTCTDSEVDFEQNDLQKNTNQNDVRQLNNYPDVVPTREHCSIHFQHHPDDNKFNSCKLTCDSIYSENSKKSNSNSGRNPSSFQYNPQYRDSSPDLLSSGSEKNVSQYQATVDASFQTVALTPIKDILLFNANERNKTLRITKRGNGDDITSIDSISNHSFDDDGDIEHNLASLSPSSSLIDGLDEYDVDEDCEGPEFLPYDLEETTTPITTRFASDNANEFSNRLPQYTAEEERKDSRNWQKVTLPDGQTRNIDMRVIEPYMRVLSHGGYLKSAGHNSIIIFCACHLPDRSRTDYNYVMDNLFLYVVKTLEQLITDDYILIYLHGGSSRRNMPPFPWLRKCYQLLDRRLRKSLKNMYLVHPTFWIKSFIWMAKPFVSTKFWRKLVYVKTLHDLFEHVTALERAAIPDRVKQYDEAKN